MQHPKLGDALKIMIDQNEFLRFGLHNRLLNLTQVARYLHPHIETRVGKDIATSAVVMALSRLQKESEERFPNASLPIVVKNISTHADLCVVSFLRTASVHAGLNRLHNQVQQERGYITFSEGVNEVSVILSAAHLPLVERLIDDSPAYTRKNVASIGIKFDVDQIESPGLFYSVFQELYFQKINVIEVASAGTELILYIDDSDVKLAFDTLYSCARDRYAPRG